MDANDLRRRRRALGLNQTDLGTLLDVPQNTISRWELGKARMQRPRMVDLALRALELERTLATRGITSAQVLATMTVEDGVDLQEET